jgi:hypothetical protein
MFVPYRKHTPPLPVTGMALLIIIIAIIIIIIIIIINIAESTPTTDDGHSSHPKPVFPNPSVLNRLSLKCLAIRSHSTLL